MTEAEFIAALRRLPLHPGARSLRDDAAMVAGLVVTTDTLVEGVHFLPGDPSVDVAWKLVAQNLSDLAAKGATPEGILLNYPLTCSSSAQAGAPVGDGANQAQSSTTEDAAIAPRPAPGWDAGFLAGLADILAAYACPLIGGDTVSLPSGAPRVLTVTALGRAEIAPARSGARAGDTLWVTGTIGDAGAGLRLLRAGRSEPASLVAAYRRPRPLLVEGRALAPVVHAMMDVSDGLLLDAARLAAASRLAVTIALDAIPLSPAYLAEGGNALAAATAGDDYQLLFALAPDVAPPVPARAVGQFGIGTGLSLTRDGRPVPLPDTLGWQHGG